MGRRTHCSGVGANGIHQHDLGRWQSGGDGHFLRHVRKLELFQVSLIGLTCIHAGQRAAHAAMAKHREHGEP